MNTNIPRIRQTRLLRTDCVRRRPIQDEQEQNRYIHGLSSFDVSLRHWFQTQMTSANLPCSVLCTNTTDLLSYSCLEHIHQAEHEHILEEIRILRAIQYVTVQPIENYYFSQEADSCNVPPHLNDKELNYGPPL